MSDEEQEHDEEGCNHGRCEYCRKNFKRIYEVLEEHERGLVTAEQSYTIFEDVMGSKTDEALDRHREITEQLRQEIDRLKCEMDTEAMRLSDTERLREDISRVRNEIARMKDTMERRK